MQTATALSLRWDMVIMVKHSLFDDAVSMTQAYIYENEAEILKFGWWIMRKTSPTTLILNLTGTLSPY